MKFTAVAVLAAIVFIPSIAVGFTATKLTNSLPAGVLASVSCSAIIVFCAEQILKHFGND